MKRIMTATLLLFVVSAIAIAEGISVRYIESNFSDNNDFKLILKKVQLSAEPYSRAWVQEWNHEVAKDSVFFVLHEAEKEFSNASQKKSTERSLLLLGMTYHFFYQLEEEPAFRKADSVFSLFQKIFPDRIEGPWFRAVHLVKGALREEGIALFDSIRTSVDVKKPEFWEDFSRYSYFAFQPHRSLMGIRKYKELTGRRSDFDNEFGDILRAKTKEMDVNANYEPKDLWTFRKDSSGFATFTSLPFGISLTIPGDWKLNFPPYSAKSKQGIFDMIPDNVVDPKTGAPIETHILLLVDFYEPRASLKEKVHSFAKEKPDVTKIRKDLDSFGAYSVLFASKAIYPHCGGSHMVLSAFDRMPPKYPGVLLEECQKVESPELTYYRMNEGLVRPSKRIRYLFLLDACHDIAEQAEKNLSLVLNGLKVE